MSNAAAAHADLEKNELNARRFRRHFTRAGRFKSGPNPARETIAAGSRVLVLDIAKFKATPKVTDPFEYVVVPDFITQDAQAAAFADFPDIQDGGLYPPESINVRGGFKKVMDELMGDAFREAVSEKFDIDLSRLPAMFTARGHLREKDGQIHNDSKTKVITVLLYFNAKPWPHEGGKLRMLRGPDDMEDFAEEVAPEGGLLIVFKRSDHSWHGHPSFVGPRKAIQLNWVTDQGVVFRETGKHNLTATIKKLKRAVGVS